MGILLFLVVVAILAPLSPYDPYDIAVGSPKCFLPSLEHPFGTDDMGRDYFTRALYGGRVSLLVGLAVSISTLFGTIYGTISGYVGGKVDAYMMRFVDIFMSIPSFLLIVIINTFLLRIFYLNYCDWFVYIAGCCENYGSRSSFAEKEFCSGIPCFGGKPLVDYRTSYYRSNESRNCSCQCKRIEFHYAGIFIKYFLGYGVSVPIPSWGGMLQNAQSFILDRPLLAFFQESSYFTYNFVY